MIVCKILHIFVFLKIRRVAYKLVATAAATAVAFMWQVLVRTKSNNLIFCMNYNIIHIYYNVCVNIFNLTCFIYDDCQHTFVRTINLNMEINFHYYYEFETRTLLFACLTFYFIYSFHHLICITTQQCW